MQEKLENITSKLNDDFSEDFFEVLHISLDQKIYFLTFSANKLDHI